MKDKDKLPFGSAHPEVLADLAAIRAAQARGELRSIGKVRVVRDGQGGRRVVPAEATRTATDRDRRLREIERDLQGGHPDRDGRLRQIERDLLSARDHRLRELEAEVFSPAERLARAQAAVDVAFAAGRISPTLLPPGLLVARVIT
jgi:hypothetical protein